MSSTFARIFGHGPFRLCPTLSALRRGGLVSVYRRARRPVKTTPLAHDDYAAAVMATFEHPPSVAAMRKNETGPEFRKRVREAFTKKFLQNLRVAADHRRVKR